MKFVDVDMQDIQKQMSPQLEVQSSSSSSNGTLDRGIRRSRPSDPMNNNSAKTTPEVIDLDKEDSPEEEALLTLNGVNTTVKKVSWPWQRTKSMGGADKIPSESSAEVPATLTSDKEDALSKELPFPAEETMGGKAVVGHHKSKKHRHVTNEHPKVVKFVSRDDKDVNSVTITKKRLSGTLMTPSPHQGERKRPSLAGEEDCDAKRPKTEAATKVYRTKSVIKEVAAEGAPVPDTKGSVVVSVVDLVDDDEVEQGLSAADTELKSAAKNESVKGAQTTANDNSAAKPRSDSKSTVTPTEKISPAASVVPVVSTRSLVNVQSSKPITPQSNSADEKKTRSLPSIVCPANGLIAQLPSIEVKKVKLCPQLEKQATAMSAVTSLTVTPAVVTPKLASGASLVQTPVSMSASIPETTEIPSLVSSKSPESAKEVVKEEDASLTGSELETKKGLNPIHSETRKRIKKLTRSELEAFFLEMACELILSKSDAGKYRQLYEEMKESAEIKAVKIAHLHKQVADLTSVVHRAINESKDKKDFLPPKVTRSVGLQLDSSNITNAYRIKSRDDKCQAHTQSSNTSSTSNHPPSASERSQLTKSGRPSVISNSKIMSHPTPNGLITGASAKDTPPGVPSPTKSPQRQLRALHPRVPQSTGPSPSPTLSSPSAQPNPEPAKKMSGFIDIAEESKNLNNASGIRRHRGSTLLVPTTAASNVNLSPALNSLSSTVVTSAVKVISPPYTQAVNITSSNYSQTGAQTRLVTATTIPVPPGTPVTTSRVTYLIPSPNSTTVQQRQLLLTSPSSQPQQTRARPPNNSPLQAVLMRPATALLQVQTGAVTSSPSSHMRTIPPASTQSILAASKNPQQQQASRQLALPSRPSPQARMVTVQHPAPLPAQPQPTVVNPNLKPIPRRPVLKLSKVANGIVLSWNMSPITPQEEIASYQLYAYQEGATAPPSPSLWKKVGDVKALPLPMACTLTQFADGHTYHFAVRAVDVHGRVGEFSVPATIELFN